MNSAKLFKEDNNINRYKVTYSNGKSLLLYKESAEDIPLNDEIGKVVAITSYTDPSHEDYIARIKDLATFLGYDNRGRECYSCRHYKGDMIIKLSKDNNKYYDIAEYKIATTGLSIHPTLLTLSTPKEVYNIITAEKPEYIVYSHRYYGQPKLAKPKELKGIKAIGSATFIPKHCKPQVYIVGNDVYIKHTDYFSAIWRPPAGERLDMPLSYYAKKYFGTDRSEKFIYPDGWSSIVLRNEAWLQLKNYLPLIREENKITFREYIFTQQQEDKYSVLNGEARTLWGKFWEEVYGVVKVAK